MYAARANLKCLLRDDGAAIQHTWRIGEALCNGLSEIFERTSTPAIVQHVGPMLQILFTEKRTIGDYREFCSFVDRDRYRRFALALFEHGVYMTPSAALHSVASLAHTDDDVAFTLEAVEKVLAGAG
jgi:glutamate-1-semialdehyde 2,1-aminomutase